ncbi:hypothetical protein F5144DRAFT_574973 [Chaetomium tenue]|uniref:Uncharacterized protein n=1 Tax=Chaetomium tenue TaxID=1854479 RepID=A0ACB7PCZ2_9PEZI|nr:hypothetical protein F5144DRAFT_574973 [Chaetomium globosum]
MDLPTPSRSPAAFRFPQPEPSSLNDVLRQNNRDRLFVRPSRWTLQHLELLGCRFLLRNIEPKSRTTETKKNKSIYSSDLASYLFRGHDVGIWSPELTFHFNQTAVATIRNTRASRCIWSSRPDLPFLKWVDGLDPQWDGSIFRRRLRCQPRYQPTNRIEDPYIVAVLIALAQAQRRSRSTAAYVKM